MGGNHEVDGFLAEEEYGVGVGCEGGVFAHVCREVEHVPLAGCYGDFGQVVGYFVETYALYGGRCHCGGGVADVAHCQRIGIVGGVG